MLTLGVRSEMISRVQAKYRESGTLLGTKAAERIMAVRRTFEHLASRFNDRQAKAATDRRPFLADGRQQTLEDQLFGPFASGGWPARAAAALHGLKLKTIRSMPDPHSYLAKIQVGPDQAREFGDYCGIAVYFDPLHLMEILWVGPEVDLEQGWEMLRSQTGGFRDWSKLRPEYQERLP